MYNKQYSVQICQKQRTSAVVKYSVSKVHGISLITTAWEECEASTTDIKYSPFVSPLNRLYMNC